MSKASNNLSILVVGNIDHWIASGRDLPKIALTEFCAYADLTAGLLLKLQPEIILSPLVTEHFDMLDLAIKLNRLNYAGRVRAITPPLPNPDMVLREIRGHCPSLDFDLFEVQPKQKLYSV